jgi:hypothetical protein
MLGYAATIGRSFATQINLLAPLIRDRHDPSLGRYKESLLVNGIRDFLPRRFEVANGFVLFPEPSIQRGSRGRNKLATENHTLSNQLDIIVFDSMEHPVVFRDGDFVIVRPESVRAVVEVKGVLDQREVDSAVDLFSDFGLKLRRYYDHAVKYGASGPHKPSLLLMGWTVGYDKAGRPKLDGGRLRKRIITRYKYNLSNDQAARIPLLESAMIYDDCEVSLDDSKIVSIPEKPNSLGALKVGYETLPGYFVRKGADGKVAREGDSTIASLVSRTQYALGLRHNPLFVAFEKDDPTEDLPHDHQGFDLWFQSESMLHPDEIDYWHRKPGKPR